MMTKNEIAGVLSLKDKKGRESRGLYCCEGEKLVAELFLSGFLPHKLFATREWLDASNILNDKDFTIEVVTASELKKISSLSTPNEVLALVRIPERTLSLDHLKHQLTLVLDTIQDPGNLGTILRIADWFGIKTIICSEGTADVYNSKVVQATMGSIFRTEVYYEKLGDFFLRAQQELKLPVYGAFLDGSSIYKMPLHKHGLIVMGNESKGISSDIETFVTHKITIPPYTSHSVNANAESLNVGVATAIICAEFRR
jgi:TrmH family RNA methyltransferase